MENFERLGKLGRVFSNPTFYFEKVQYWIWLKNYQNKIQQNLPSLARQPSIEECRDILRRILNKNIIPFWYPEVVDQKYGGYRINHDLNGAWMGPANKLIIPQARTLWFFSILAASKYGNEEHLTAARQGFNFLSSAMWDQEHGGFFWEVDPSGELPIDQNKDMVGQVFGLYAVSQYAITSGDPAATELAHELFGLFERHAYDAEYGGYKEILDRHWKLVKDSSSGISGGISNIKTLNFHLHMLEAMTTYATLANDPKIDKKLVELILIQSGTVVRKTIGVSTNKHQMNWQPILRTELAAVNYGHELENIWLLIEACNTAQVPVSLLMDYFETSFNYSLKYGYDRRQGGFFRAGPLNMAAYFREKIWWTQSECLVGALKMYEITQEEKFFNCFSQTLNWINQFQVDWKNGEWYEELDRKGKPSGVKAGPWKTPYHNGRAVLECLKVLDSMESV